MRLEWLMTRLIGFGVALAVFGVAMVYLTDSTIMFTRRFWLDEYLTSLIVRDPSISHSIAAVKSGVDTNPPTYHLLLRAFYAVVVVSCGGPPTAVRRVRQKSGWPARIVTGSAGEIA